MRWLTGLSGSAYGVALCILFSAGTFLYAACVHLLPDAKNFTGPKLGTLVAAAALPCVITSLGGHHH